MQISGSKSEQGLTEQVSGQPSLGSERNHWKQKAGVDEGAMFQSQQAAELGSFQHVVLLALESRTGRKGLWDLPLLLRKATWGQACGRGVPERRLRERIVWSYEGEVWIAIENPQEVRDARAVRYLLRKVVTREWNQPKRKVLQSTKVTGVGDLKSILTSDMEMQNL